MHFLKGFRSSRGLGAGELDAEFEAFQAAQPLGVEALGHDALHFEKATNPVIRDLYEPQLPSWALDFQALQLHEYQTSPISSSQLREQAPLHLTFPKSRHSQFTRPNSQALLPNDTQQKPKYRGAFGQIHQTNYNLFDQPHDPFSTRPLQNMQLDHQTGELLDDDALQRAFDAAQQIIDESAEHTQQVFPMHAREALIKSVPEKSAHGLDHQHSSKNQVESNGGLENTGEGQPGDHDADELARTAGELLDNVRHDQNPKFQNSSFLSLMRQLRDREVHVEGDKIINVSN